MEPWPYLVQERGLPLLALARDLAWELGARPRRAPAFAEVRTPGGALYTALLQDDALRVVSTGARQATGRDFLSPACLVLPLAELPEAVLDLLLPRLSPGPPPCHPAVVSSVKQPRPRPSSSGWAESAGSSPPSRSTSRRA